MICFFFSKWKFVGHVTPQVPPLWWDSIDVFCIIHDSFSELSAGNRSREYVIAGLGDCFAFSFFFFRKFAGWWASAFMQITASGAQVAFELFGRSAHLDRHPLRMSKETPWSSWDAQIFLNFEFFEKKKIKLIFLLKRLERQREREK